MNQSQTIISQLDELLATLDKLVAEVQASVDKGGLKRVKVSMLGDVIHISDDEGRGFLRKARGNDKDMKELVKQLSSIKGLKVKTVG